MFRDHRGQLQSSLICSSVVGGGGRELVSQRVTFGMLKLMGIHLRVIWYSWCFLPYPPTTSSLTLSRLDHGGRWIVPSSALSSHSSKSNRRHVCCLKPGKMTISLLMSQKDSREYSHAKFMRLHGCAVVVGDIVEENFQVMVKSGTSKLVLSLLP